MSSARSENTSKVIATTSAIPASDPILETEAEEPFLRDLQLTVKLSTILDAEEASTAPSPSPSSPPDLPLEVVESIIRWTQSLEECADELRGYSLVSCLWAKAAQRVLFGQLQRCVSSEAIKRLRQNIEGTPDLASYIRKIDLGNPNDRWDPRKIKEFFRRASGLLRQLPHITEISILHIALTDPIRDKFYKAITCLPVRSAAFDSSCWSGSNSSRQGSPGSQPDIEALALVLCRWRKLTSLNLHGYSHYPRVISANVLPCHTLPSYELKSLEITSSEITGAAGMLWLLGKSGGTLRTLTLTSVTGLSTEDYGILLSSVASTLEELQLSIDQDDLTMPVSLTQPQTLAAARTIDPSVFGKMHHLDTFIFTTDLEISTPLLANLAQLENLAYVGFNCPSLPYTRTCIFISECRSSVRDVCLDIWGEDETWSSFTRYRVASLCRDKDIDLLMDGSDAEMLEDMWFGIGPEGYDMSRLWSRMEACSWPTMRRATVTLEDSSGRATPVYG